MSPRFSKSDGLFQLLSTQSTFLVDTANILAELVNAEPTSRHDINHRLHDAEHGADQASHEVLKVVNQSFVLPFDREDLYALTGSIDDVVDLIDEAGDNIVLYKPSSLPEGTKTQVELLQKCAQRTCDAINDLSNISENFREYWIEINELENQGDKLYRSMIADLFDGETDALEVMKIKAVLDALEGAMDAFEELSGTIESIVIKES